MKVATSDLIGPALDWAYMKADGWEAGTANMALHLALTRQVAPSIKWDQGGPLIEREKIGLDYFPDGNYPNGGEWGATAPYEDKTLGATLVIGFGPTPLVAVMRAYVTRMLGDVVEIPEELA